MQKTPTIVTDDPQIEIEEMGLLDTLQTLDDIELIPEDEDPPKENTCSNDDAMWVMSFELIQPLGQEDILDARQEDDEPTRFDLRFHPRANQPLFLPNSDPSLPRLEVVDDDRLGMREVIPAGVILPKVVPPPKKQATDSPRMSSIAPVTLATEFDEDNSQPRLPVVRPAKPRTNLYSATVGALAVAAAVVGFWTLPEIMAATNPPQTVNAVDSPAIVSAHDFENEIQPASIESVVHELEPVIIVGDGMPSASQSASVLEEGQSPKRWEPKQDVLIDDSLQLTEGVVFPSHFSDSNAKDEPVSPSTSEPQNEPEPSQPPASSQPSETPSEPAFDTSAASAAMLSAAQAARACAPAGVGRFPARVSVTFAPQTGGVTTATVDSPWIAGTDTTRCIVAKFRSIRVSPFSGPLVTVHKTFEF